MSIAKLAIIIRQSDGYHVYSEDKSRHLGGPYPTLKKAQKRLDQVEYWKRRRLSGKAPNKPGRT